MDSARLGNAVRIVVAPDKFKGSLSAGEAARCLSKRILNGAIHAALVAHGGHRAALGAKLFNTEEAKRLLSNH
jgi:glycerate kinase